MEKKRNKRIKPKALCRLEAPISGQGVCSGLFLLSFFSFSFFAYPAELFVPYT
jgi:hypothetical protein